MRVLSGCPGLLLLLLLSLSLPAVVAAQDEGGEHDDPIAQRPAGADAQATFVAGMEAFDSGDYERAITAFQETYTLAPHPDIQFNIYSAAERGGQLELAAQALERYLLTGEPAERRTVLVARLERLRGRIAADREAQAAEDAAAEEAAQADRAAQARHEADLARARPERVVVPDPEGVHPAGPILLVSGGVLLASFGAFAGLAAAEDGALAGSCGRDAGGTCTSDQVAGLESLNLAADIAWISASVLGVAGLILLFALPPEDGMSLSVLPWATPTAAGVTLGGVL